MKTGSPVPTALTTAAADQGDPVTATAVNVPTASTFVGATPAALGAEGGASTSWARTNSGNPQSSTIVMDGFAPPSSLSMPKGAVLTSARLLVTHSEKTASAISIRPNGTTPAPPTLTHALPVRTAMQMDAIDLLALPGGGQFQDYVHDQGFTGAQVVFTGNPKINETTTLDAVRLELTLYLPRFRGQTSAGLGGATNCLETLNACAVISTPTNYKDSFYIQGTTYVPISRIDLNLNQATSQVMRFGLIARSLAARTTGGYAYTGPVIELPDNSPGWGFKGTLVQLKVYLCPNSPTCSTSTGRLALTARVQVWDDNGSPEPPKRQVTVMSWSHKR